MARLVLVDDDAAARRMMVRALGRRGYEVHEAHDGRSGIDMVRERRPDAVLLDLRMPGELNGLDVARLLKSDPSTATIPIIVVTASVHMDAKAAINELQCDGFVAKPVDFDVLEQTIGSVLTR